MSAAQGGLPEGHHSLIRVKRVSMCRDVSGQAGCEEGGIRSLSPSQEG